MNHANQREILGCRNTIIIEAVGIQVHPAELENFTHMLIYKGNNNTTKKWGWQYGWHVSRHTSLSVLDAALALDDAASHTTHFQCVRHTAPTRFHIV